MIDTLLDRTIALGYGRPGLAIRRRLPGWPADPGRIEGRVVLVTGAASGLGLAAASGLARLGAVVHAHARSAERAEAAVAAVERAVPGAAVRPAVCDLASLGEVAAFARAFAAAQPRLDLLVNNAGAMPPERTASGDGHELMFATHVLAVHALIAGLREPLRRAAPGRVVNVSSGGMYAQAIPSGDLQSRRAPYNPRLLYARSKREQLVLGEEWAARLAGQGVVVHSMHPGWVDTPGLREAMPRFHALARPLLRGPDEGADTIVWLGAAPAALAGTGRFWQDRRPRPTHYALGAGEDPAEVREELWWACEELTGAGASAEPEGGAAEPESGLAR